MGWEKAKKSEFNIRTIKRLDLLRQREQSICPGFEYGGRNRDLDCG
jgi:hypothetical protein